MNRPKNIPFEDFGGIGIWLHFAHANGYPPSAYLHLLRKLGKQYQVVAMRTRPLWEQVSPSSLSDWSLLADDFCDFLDQQNLTELIGVGHSMGATTTLRLALRQPTRFRALVLIDPVLFPPLVIYFWKIIWRLGLAYRLHPLIKSAMKRRESFENKAAMFENYRGKAVFSRMSDESLHAYVDALSCPRSDGNIRLCYPAQWEARIYATSLRIDMDLWRGLAGLRPPVLFLRGSNSDTFKDTTVRMIQHKLPNAQFAAISNSTHLLPLEKPDQVYEEIIHFLLEGI